MEKERFFSPQALGTLACLTEALSTADQQKKDELIKTARAGIDVVIQLTENPPSPPYPRKGRIGSGKKPRMTPEQIAKQMLAAGKTPQEIGERMDELLKNKA